MRYASDQFTESFVTTIGVDFSVRVIELDDKIIKLQLWDCAGQERFKSIVTSYYKGAHGVILTYSITNRLSFDNIKNWYVDCKNKCNKNVNFMLVGTKLDLEKNREVSHKEGEELAKQLGANFIETSAKLDIGVDIVFTELAKLTMNTFIIPKLKAKEEEKNNINLSNSTNFSKNKKFKCC